jgi:hypothetical protein
MHRLICYVVAPLLIVVGLPLLAYGQEHFRLVSHKAVSVVSLEGPSAVAGGGPGSAGIVYGYSTGCAAAMTEDGHLVINGDYYGQVATDVITKVVVASGRVFLDGIRRQPSKFPKDVEDRFFGEPDEAYADMDLSQIVGWKGGAKVLVRDARTFACAGNRQAIGIGPYVVGMAQGVFSVWGVPFGPVQEGDVIEVYRDRVLVNGDVRAPAQATPEKR